MIYNNFIEVPMFLDFIFDKSLVVLNVINAKTFAYSAIVTSIMHKSNGTFSYILSIAWINSLLNVTVQDAFLKRAKYETNVWQFRSRRESVFVKNLQSTQCDFIRYKMISIIVFKKFYDNRAEKVNMWYKFSWSEMSLIDFLGFHNVQNCRPINSFTFCSNKQYLKLYNT